MGGCIQSCRKVQFELPDEREHGGKRNNLHNFCFNYKKEDPYSHMPQAHTCVNIKDAYASIKGLENKNENGFETESSPKSFPHLALTYPEVHRQLNCPEDDSSRTERTTLTTQAIRKYGEPPVLNAEEEGLDGGYIHVCYPKDNDQLSVLDTVLEHEKELDGGYLSVINVCYDDEKAINSTCQEENERLLKTCSDLKKTCPNTEHVWPAIETSTKQIVICVNDRSNNDLIEEQINNFRILRSSRLKSKRFTDSLQEKINSSYESLKFESKVVCHIKEVINKNAESLFQKHNNLSAISGCPYQIREGEFHSCWCIVLFCCCKGYVPIEEKEFPKMIEDIPVDVREGCFSFGTIHKSNDNLCDASDFYSPISIGKCIAFDKSSLSGTAGAYVTFQQKNRSVKGILTCAHAAFPTTNLQRCKDYLKECQISLVNEQYRLGEVCDAEFRYGDPSGTSIDAALVEVDQHFLPKYGEFTKGDQEALTNAGFCKENPPCYCHGRILEKEGQGTKSIPVFKYGASTGLTNGILTFDGLVCRSDSLGFSANDPCKCLLYGQLHIISNSQGHDFFTAGDSGSVIFHNKGNEIVAVGLAIGMLDDKTCIATDIKSVFNSFPDRSVRMTKFQCTDDSGIYMRHNDEPIAAENMTSDFQNISLGVRPKVYPRKRTRTKYGSSTHSSEELNIQSKEGIKIDATNCEVELKRGSESLMLRTSCSTLGSRLSITSPDMVHVSVTSPGECQLKTPSEIWSIKSQIQTKPQSSMYGTIFPS